MSHMIVVKRPRPRTIKRDGKGAVIRISNEAADVLDGLLEKAGGCITVLDLASSLIEYAAKDTIIKIEEDEGNE